MGTAASRQPRLLALVFAGGAVGTLARALLESAFPVGPGAFPWTTFGINIGGAFSLGLLLTVLARLGPDGGWRQAVRLGLGTGLLGGFTTYSLLAVETLQRLPLVGLGYAIASVVLGVAAAGLGVRAARLVVREPRP
ncbi:CrcB family protein [Ammonicoccus fulvus]|uniref:Fluoride-specific ion channel FluC n=1 Tax=Ammonicoccus fulvus TaxID=3138240 RepID=A0ABZ3FNG4_9ACTN